MTNYKRMWMFLEEEIEEEAKNEIPFYSIRY